MPVIFYNLEEQKSLEREPYKTLSKKFRNINYALDNCEIKLDIGSDDEGFSDGFYTDFNFTNNAELKFVFSRSDETHAKNKPSSILVSMLYSFECNSYNEQFYRHFIELLKKRLPYFYIPNATHFSFSSQQDDNFVFQFNALVDDENNVLEVCYSLLNQLIAILSFED